MVTQVRGSIANKLVERINDKASLSALTAQDGDSYYLKTIGVFTFDSSDLSSEVSADPEQNTYIAPDSDLTGASGVWVKDGVASAASSSAGKLQSSVDSGITPGGSYEGSVIKTFLEDAASNKKQAYFPAGIYTVTSPISIEVSDIIVVGDGKATGGTKIVSDYDDDTVFEFNHVSSISNIVFKDLCIEQPSVVGTGVFGNAVITDATSQPIDMFRMENVKIVAAVQSGVWFGDSLTGDLTNFHVEGCEITCSNDLVYGFVLRKPCNGFVFKNNTVTLSDVGSYNSLGLYADCTNFEVAGNRFFGGGHSPIACSPARYGIIRDNILENTLFTQIANEFAIEAEWKDGHFGVDTSHDIVIDSNIIKGTYWAGIGCAQRDSVGDAPYNITITNNTVSNTETSGISITPLSAATGDTHDVLIANNRVISAGGQGINIDEGAYDIDIKDNVVISPTGAGIRLRGNNSGLVGADRANKIRVVGNTTKSTTLEGIAILGCYGDIQIVGNTIQDSSANGIRSELVTRRLQINSNTISGAAFVGINIIDNVSYAQINDNYIAGTVSDGIRMGANNGIISNNLIAGDTLTDNGTGNSVSNNKVI